MSSRFRIPVLCILAVIALIFLSGCADPLSEQELAKGLQESEFYKTPDAKIAKFAITKRQTNKKDKTDKVYCDVTAASDTVEYTCFYRIGSTFHDQGRMVDYICKC